MTEHDEHANDASDHDPLTAALDRIDQLEARLAELEKPPFTITKDNLTAAFEWERP